jgi:predicted ATPase/DNA-binding CsgD family transcriptional regulator
MTRLLTLTGAGGSGKTRLALEVASDLVGAYRDGVWLVELAPLSEGALVVQAAAAALGVQERAGEPLDQTLVDVLQSRDMLVVLDNCEHLVEAAASLADVLLDACQDLKILATSREALGVPGEIRWTVPALSTPDPRRSPAVGELQIYESVRLFAERARHREATFALTSSNARPVAEICMRLDGIPLAVELAAARVGTLGVVQISERLGDSLQLLTAGGRTAVPRQRTLRGALDWSHDLLAVEEMRLFRRLSEFAGGWTIEAAEFVCSGHGIDESDVLDLLSGLADKSLLVTRTGDDGTMRYRFLEPVRQYAEERLEESRETEDIRRRHASYFLALAEEAEPQLRGREQAAWLGRLDSELDNIRAALFWSLERADHELVSRASGALLFFWTWRGYLREGCRWLEASLTGAATPSVRAKALNGLANLEIMLGEYDRSAALLDESLALYRAEGDKNGIAACLCDLGWLAMFRGDIKKAQELLEESIALGRAVGDDLRVAFALNRLSSLAMADLDNATATALLEESLALYREAGDGRSEAMCLGMLGGLAILQGDLGRATDLLEDAIAQLRRVGSAVDAFYPCCLAVAATLRGQHGRAEVLLEEGLVLGQTSGNRLHTLQCIEAAMMLAADLTQAEKAARMWGAAEASRDAIGAPLQPVDREFYGPYLDTARTELGEEAWSAARNRGRTMTLDEAVEYAMTTHTATPHASPHEGGPPVVLTRREREVAALVARGLTNARISSELYISERTAENHVAKILKKLGLRSREQVSAHLGDL